MIIVMIVMMIDINLDISWSYSARSNRYHDIDGWLYLPTWPWGKVDKTCAQFWRQQQMVVIVIVLMMMVVGMMTVMVLLMLMVMVMMTVIVVTMVSKRLNYGVNNRWLSSSGSRRCHHKDAKRLNGSNIKPELAFEERGGWQICFQPIMRRSRLYPLKFSARGSE